MKITHSFTSALFLVVIMFCTFLSVDPFVGNVYGETFQGWQVAEGPYGSQYTYGGKYFESNGTLTLMGDDRAAGPTLYRKIAPTSDFQISLQVKAATLGEVNREPDGAGEGFALALRPNTNFSSPSGCNFEFRARGGGQFLLARYVNGYGLDWMGGSNSVSAGVWDWTPFVYNTLGYNDGYAFWHLSPPEVLANANVRPNVWYTMVLKVHETPFLYTAEVRDENGTLLGLFSASDMINCGFKDIKYVGISSGFGGEFYVRNFNITGITPFNYLPDEPITSTPKPTPTTTSPTPYPTSTYTPAYTLTPSPSLNPAPAFPSSSPRAGSTWIPIILEQNSGKLEKTTLPLATVASVTIAATAVVFASLLLRRLYRTQETPVKA